MLGSGYSASIPSNSFSDNCGNSVDQKERKSADVEMDLGTYMVPSLWLKPVSIGTLFQLPECQAESGRRLMSSPSMTGCQAHRTEGFQW